VRSARYQYPWISALEAIAARLHRELGGHVFLVLANRYEGAAGCCDYLGGCANAANNFQTTSVFPLYSTPSVEAMAQLSQRATFFRNFVKIAIPLLITWYIATKVTYHIMDPRWCPKFDKPRPKYPNAKKYPNGVPAKFDPDGNVQPYPGNTIIAHLSPSSDLYASMLVLYDKLHDSHLSHLFTLLPPSSWHMTIFEGVCDQVRKPGYWPSDLAIDAPLAECNDLFTKKLSTFDLQCDPPYLMSVVGWNSLKTGIGVHVEPRSTEENKRLRGQRDRLADLLLIRHPDHATYGLHLSVAYLLRHLTDAQKSELTALLIDHFDGMPKEFELSAPEFCKFDNMFAFQRQFYLEDHTQ
jgi:hypothetical protein